MTNPKDKQREYNRRSYAKKLGITVEQLDARRKAAREWKERNKHRLVGRKYVSETEAEKAREANRRSYAKKVGKPIPPKGNQYGESDRIGKVKWSDLKEKWKEFEGKPLEKSINTPIFLTQSIRRQYKERAEN